MSRRGYKRDTTSVGDLISGSDSGHHKNLRNALDHNPENHIASN